MWNNVFNEKIQTQTTPEWFCFITEREYEKVYVITQQYFKKPNRNNVMFERYDW